MISLNGRPSEVERLQKCACKGIRHCAVCDPELVVSKDTVDILPLHSDHFPVYVLCISCGDKFCPLNSNVRLKLERFLKNQIKLECICEVKSNERSDFHIEGVFLKSDFLTPDCEAFLIDQIDTQNQWVESQSGRFKQDFGPKANFNKKKLKYSTFTGTFN